MIIKYQYYWNNSNSLECQRNNILRIIKSDLEDDVEVLWGDIIKGSAIIGKGSFIESSVNMTGSDEYPLRIGNNVVIKGTSYLFGTTVDDDIYIEHSVLIKKHVKKLIKQNGEVQQIRFYLPMPAGIDAVDDVG